MQTMIQIIHQYLAIINRWSTQLFNSWWSWVWCIYWAKHCYHATANIKQSTEWWRKWVTIRKYTLPAPLVLESWDDEFFFSLLLLALHNFNVFDTDCSHLQTSCSHLPPSAQLLTQHQNCLRSLMTSGSSAGKCRLAISANGVPRASAESRCKSRSWRVLPWDCEVSSSLMSCDAQRLSNCAVRRGSNWARGWTNKACRYAGLLSDAYHIKIQSMHIKSHQVFWLMKSFLCWKMNAARGGPNQML